MKQLLTVTMLALLALPVAAQADENATIEDYREIIATRCTKCHDAGRIEQAMAEGRNVDEILEKMERMMAREKTPLSDRDKSVLGVFWGSPFKEEKK